MILNSLLKKRGAFIIFGCLVVEQISIYAFLKKGNSVCGCVCALSPACLSVCVCLHQTLLFFPLLFPSVKTSLQKFNSRTAYPTNPPSPTPFAHPAPLPGFPASCVLKLQRVWRHCGKCFPSSRSLHSPFFLFLIFFSFHVVAVFFCFAFCGEGARSDRD